MSSSYDGGKRNTLRLRDNDTKLLGGRNVPHMKFYWRKRPVAIETEDTDRLWAADLIDMANQIPIEFPLLNQPPKFPAALDWAHAEKTAITVGANGSFRKAL